MDNKKHNTIYRKNYTPLPYVVTTVDLRFELDETATRVHSTMSMSRNLAVEGENLPLELNAEKLVILSVRVDGVALESSEYTYDGKMLRIENVQA